MQIAGVIVAYASFTISCCCLINRSFIFHLNISVYARLRHGYATRNISIFTTKQASAAFPENTLASFERAIRDGSEGVESGNVSYSLMRADCAIT